MRIPAYRTAGIARRLAIVMAPFLLVACAPTKRSEDAWRRYHDALGRYENCAWKYPGQLSVCNAERTSLSTELERYQAATKSEAERVPCRGLRSTC